MENKEKNRLPLAPGDGSSLASSGALVSGLSLASVGLEVKENEDLSVFIDDSSKHFEDLQESIDGKFTPKKVTSHLLADTYFLLDDDRRALKVFDCGSFLEFHLVDGSWKLAKSNFCKDRLCPMCNWRKSRKIFSRVSQLMDYVQPQGFQFVFLTLTLANEPAECFSDMVQAFFDGWRFMYNKHKPFKKIVKGALRTFETTINHKTHTFHFHSHIVLAVPRDYYDKFYITQARWSEMWRKSCKIGYTPVVDVRRFKPKPGSSGLGSAVAEACKYAVKDSDFLVDSPEWRMKYTEALSRGLVNRRLFSATGCFREAFQALRLSDPEAGHLTDDVMREDVADMIVRYGWRDGVYCQIDI